MKNLAIAWNKFISAYTRLVLTYFDTTGMILLMWRWVLQDIATQNSSRFSSLMFWHWMSFEHRLMNGDLNHD